jgi:tRNA A-37 threonylcarbamoyl transferase component Bud32
MPEQGRFAVVDWIGRTISNVKIEELLGRGGMADVYLGVHTTLNRQVAVKILHGHLVEDESFMARFRSEAQAVANLRHPHIVQVHDFNLAEGHPYMVMELVQGITLGENLAQVQRAGKRLSPQTVARLMTTIASALDYAHSRGVVHRDIKPSNVMLRRDAGPWDPATGIPDDAEPVLTDFGIARVANTAGQTASGSIVGTPSYMSPEQINAQPIDARSDVYSAGVMLYEMIAGRLPFGADEDTTAAAVLVQHISTPPPAIPEAPLAVQAVVKRALAKDRDARYQTAGDMAYELKQAYGLPISTEERLAHEESVTLILPQQAQPDAVPKRRGLLAVVMVIALLGLGGLAVLLSGVLDDAASDAAEVTYGVVRFSNANAEVDQVTVTATSLTLPPEEKQYEVWLLGIENRESIGVLELDENGDGTLIYVDPNGDNLIAEFERFEITVEDMDSNPLPSSEVVYSGAIPPEPLVHVRHLLSAFPRTPDSTGLMIGLMRDVVLLQEHADDLADAFEAEDIDEVRRHAEALVNLIEGESGENMGDVDGDGDTFNPGDGYGLLPNGTSSGYIQTAIEHANFAAGTDQATAFIIAEAQEVTVVGQNLGGWGAQLHEAALAVAHSDDLADAGDHIQAVLDLVDLFVHGQDVNDNGIVEPIQNEGGAEVMYDYALNLGIMFVLEGADRTPVPATTNPNPNVLPEYGN